MKAQPSFWGSFLGYFYCFALFFPGQEAAWCLSPLSCLRLFLGKKAKICHQREGASQAPCAAEAAACCLSWVLLAVR